MTLRPHIAISLLLLAVSIPVFAEVDDSAWYEVRPGDNLTRIAYRLGVSVADVKRDNGLRSDVIHPGQRLEISRPYSRAGERDVDWQRPASRLGRVLREFGPYKNDVGATLARRGVDLVARTGTEVNAPAHGICRFVGEVDGYGTLVILEHAGGYSTVLGPLERSSVTLAVGQAVWQGELVARTGDPVEGSDPYLHVQLRKHEQAIRPTPLLR